MELPFSLQETCLLYLVGHLDSYSPETLSLLPAHLRHQLLCHLSAFDLQKLENTPVTSGLEISAYWKALCEYVTRVFYLSVKELELDYKTSFLLTLARHITFSKAGYHDYVWNTSNPCVLLGKGQVETYAKLFCLPCQYEIHKFKQDHHDDTSSALKYIQAVFSSLGLNYFDISLGLVTSIRFKNNSFHPWDYYSPECSLSLMKLLMDHFKFHLRILTFDVEIPKFYGRDKKRLNVVKRFLSNAIEFKLFGIELHQKVTKFWKDILTANFLSEKACVSKLYFSGGGSYGELTFAKSIELLSPFLAYPTSGLSPYKGLEEIEIQGICDEKRRFGSVDQHPLCKLAVIIDNQDQLKTLHISGKFRDTSECAVLMMAVVRTIEKPRFEYLEINVLTYSSEVNVELFSKVVLAYLFLPTSHEQNFKLTIKEGCKTSTKKLPIKSVSETFNKASVDGQDKKSLFLDVPDEALLSMLFSEVKSEHNVTLKTVTCPLSQRLSCLSNIATTDVDLTSWSRCTKRIPDAKALILNDKIKHLTVNVPRFGQAREDFISGFGPVLSEHATSYRSLGSINICDHSTDNTDDDYYPLCDALVSLTQVNSLELTLSENYHSIKYLTILLKIWKERNPVHKFQKLIIAPNDVNNDLNSLREMCTDIIFVEQKKRNRRIEHGFNHDKRC